MRAENAAALTNFLLVLLIVAGLMIGSSSSNGAVVYSNPTKAVFQAAAFGVLVLAFVGFTARGSRLLAHVGTRQALSET